MSERMNPEVKALWLTALRSGEYKQGYEVLRTTENCFCTWGVLCDIAVKEGVPVSVEQCPDACFAYDGNAYRAPRAVKDWAGIKGTPELGREDLTISFLNDERRLSFPEMARLIKEYL